MVKILVAGGVALLITLVGTKFWIRFLEKRAYGQFIRSDGPTAHHVKRGTPTMGGVILVFAVVIGYVVSHIISMLVPTLTSSPPSMSGLLLLGLIVGLGIVGFIDDWLKISHAQSLGLGSVAKFSMQAVVAIIFGILALHFPDRNGVEPASRYISFLRDISWLGMPFVVAVIWMAFLIVGFSNATNLTDGLDGLLTGSASMVFIAYGVVNIWQINQFCGSLSTVGPKCYDVRNPLDLAIIAMAFAGGLFGFLWWNAHPAKIFLGDTGSLAIGGAIAGLAIMTRTELLIIIIGLLFVLEATSVMAQVGFFKLTKGKRLFKMAPLHHHFEMLGWGESTVVVRFWIIAGLSVLAGAGLFYAEWVAGS
ncbi:MAG: phospho-N-acetylmuramoyl-pentapeptide-transferase [Propionibacteriaceae bacterium]|jgi:phospho-N-acetylmuramoyl-pentapeptide-transferase|nr:phospho-N-acetylmuramoyl-pentapeptide-transferase [Propionibacteriaceae bacterium]